MGMTLTGRTRIHRALLLLCFILGLSGTASAAVISVGTFPDLNPSPSISIPAGTFLVPVQISGAGNLQTWQFDLLYDSTVVAVVDPLDGSSGIYGAEFTPGDPASLSFILSGFPFFDGVVDDIAGAYPFLLTGPSGNGILAYVLFQFLPDQQNNDPNFSVANESVFQVPEPSTLALLAAVSLIFALGRRRFSLTRLANNKHLATTRR
jgi:hypothetical protein